MQLITTLIHPDLTTTTGNVLRRRAARGIVLREDAILLVFTERYNDFSFPGGGIGDGEDLMVGLRRELEEETGARDVKVLRNYGYIEEFRPHWKPGIDLMHMTSHFFICDVHPQLRETKMESYEQANGMHPLWVKLEDAIAHNRAVMQRRESTMGQSIQRETFMLEKVARELLESDEASIALEGKFSRSEISPGGG
jgi:8-oxo-dGTP pyrophosphatase MutT (NUDIX family)